MSSADIHVSDVLPVAPSVCKACEHNEEHGWWGVDTMPDDEWTHHGACHTSFPGTQRWGHCVADGCCGTFSGVSTFDAHKNGNCPIPQGSEGFPLGGGRMAERKWHEKGEFWYYGSADPYRGPRKESHT